MGVGTIVRGIAIGLGAMLVIAAVTALWVWLYAVALAPGHPPAFYQDYGRAAVPLADIALGIPLFVLAGRLARRPGGPVMSALMPAIAFMIADAGLSLTGGAWAPAWAVALSWASKLVAAAAGGLIVRRAIPT